MYKFKYLITVCVLKQAVPYFTRSRQVTGPVYAPHFRSAAKLSTEVGADACMEGFTSAKHNTLSAYLEFVL